MWPKRRGLPLTLDTVTESTLVLNISSTAALICGLVAWSATRNTYWRVFFGNKGLFFPPNPPRADPLRPPRPAFFLPPPFLTPPPFPPAAPSGAHRGEDP